MYVFFGSRREGTWDVPGTLPRRPGALWVFKNSVQMQFVLMFRPSTVTISTGKMHAHSSFPGAELGMQDISIYVNFQRTIDLN